MILGAIANDYIVRFRVNANRERRFYKIQGTLGTAIRVAALSHTEGGKRHGHQRRIPRRVLEAAERRLQAAAATLKRAKSFAELHQTIAQEIGPIHGIGELAIYDIAHRIGAYLGHEPKAVYLHAGTREGARALNLAGKTVPLRAIPAPLRKLSAAEVEDCLCIYKTDLRRAGLGHLHRSWCGPVRIRGRC